MVWWYKTESIHKALLILASWKFQTIRVTSGDSNDAWMNWLIYVCIFFWWFSEGGAFFQHFKVTFCSFLCVFVNWMFCSLEPLIGSFHNTKSMHSALWNSFKGKTIECNNLLIAFESKWKLQTFLFNWILIEKSIPSDRRIPTNTIILNTYWHIFCLFDAIRLYSSRVSLEKLICKINFIWNSAPSCRC